MKKFATAALALLLAVFPGFGTLADGSTALDAFYALMDGDDAAQDTAKSADAWLDEIMAGEYGEDTDPEALAAILEPLAGITDRDIAAYASNHGLKMARVRNAYYKALANALGAEIAVHPATEEKYRNIQSILRLFLEPEAEDQASADKAEVRARMTPDYSRKLAEQSGLPVSFVEFIIMDRHWDDEDWENDDEWRATSNWGVWSGDGFDDIVIGSRDDAESDRIADLQDQLIGLGYLKGKADGIFGPRTQSALMEFQLANGIRPTGSYSFGDYDKLRSGNAVARWDYGEDFWDSEDFDTYDTPNTPDGDTPDRNTNDTPDRNTSDTPDHVTNDTPDRNTNNTPDRNTSDTPDRATNDTPDRNTNDTPDRNTSDTPDRATNDTPDRNTNNTPDRNTSDTPDRATNDTPDRNTNNTPDRNTSDTPDTDSPD